MLFDEFQTSLLEYIEVLFQEKFFQTGSEDIDTSAITIESTKDTAFGDIATNAAMVLAKQVNMPPRSIAEKIADKFQNHPDVANATVAGPGFINLTLNLSAWYKQLTYALDSKKKYGALDRKSPDKINIEYISANPTGPLHVGHMRGAAFGDALARLLEFSGFDITREYYINDKGGQIDSLARSVYARYQQLFDPTLTIDNMQYSGEYLIDVGEQLKDKYGAKFLGMKDVEWLPTLREFAVESMMDLIKKDLESFGITFDVFSSEKAVANSKAIEAAIKVLDDQDLIYTGALEPPKGHDHSDWESREQQLFRSTLYGDDTDRPLQKGNGEWTYFASDIAYQYDKFRRGFSKLIIVLGTDHGGYIPRLQAAMSAYLNTRIKMGNDEFILYIKKNCPDCSLDNNELGMKIWVWLRDNANGEKTRQDVSAYWGEKGSFVEPNKLPKTATQFEFDRDKLPALYTYLDELGGKNLGTKIKMGNDEFILYIRKNYPGCSLLNDNLGTEIEEWIRDNANGEKTRQDVSAYWGEKTRQDVSAYWGEDGSFVGSNKLPKTATQFEFDRDKLPALYTYLDELGETVPPLTARTCNMNMVKLLRNGEPFTMSKRAGTFVTWSDLLEIVGSDVAKFVMLTRKNDAPLDFDFDKILEQSRTNPVFYVQYACARIRSVFRNVAAEGLESCTNDPEHAVFKRLSEPLELVLIKKIAFWPRIIEQSTKAYEPHRIAFYLYELSGCIHELWDCGRKNSDIRFIRKDDTELTRARLALLQAAERVLHLGLKILGVTPVQEM